jgi:hypothetical protein
LFDCSLRSRGSRSEAAAFLSHSQTKSVSARLFVQDSGARSCRALIRPPRRRWRTKQRVHSLLLTTAARETQRSQIMNTSGFRVSWPLLALVG